ncbi:hypothetical protein HNR61_009065 [Actinomadura namibiensis]|uniref:Uncharacterized protein n=1 Tax=Actinomadura namibiensis TaxID=182080 RepID=A0A7W3QS83_ACTNM|nr:hypothetical protein [Actinomadura namibiensis]
MSLQIRGEAANLRASWPYHTKKRYKAAEFEPRP